jgi:hypothetical protein
MVHRLLKPPWTGGSVLLLLFGLVISPANTKAQPLELDTPADSPLWWTLTDELTPQELRSIYRDDAGHLKRYQAAVEAGLASPLDERQKKALKFYYNPDQNPELMPMWLAFSAFATAHLEDDGPSITGERLVPYGISPGGIDAILSVGEEQLQEETQMVEDLKEEGLEFMQVFQRMDDLASAPAEVKEHYPVAAARRLTHEGLREAFEREDVELLAAASGESPEKIARLIWVAKANPPAATAGENLVTLHARLSAEDWNAFRRFLLEKVVSRMGAFADFQY